MQNFPRSGDMYGSYIKNIIKWTVPLISMAFLMVLVSISAAEETYRTSFDRLFARSLGLQSFDLFTEA